MYADSVLDSIGDTPLVELSALRPDGGVRVLVKLEGTNPTGSMKDRMALSTVRGARADGTLDPGQHVVEYTGGSTGASLALVCSVLGHPLTLVTADCFSAEKIATMRAFGADVEVTETPDGTVYPGLKEEWDERIRELVDDMDAYWAEQFENPYVPRGYHSLGEEILAACPEVTDFVMAVGTGGCSMGVSAVLRSEGVRTTLVEPTESPYLSTGTGGSHGVEGTAVTARPPHVDDELYDEVRTVPESEARTTARTLAREMGVFGGVSTGMNVVAAVDRASELSPDDAVVTIACDTGLKYLAGDLYR